MIELAAEYGTMRKALKGILDEAQCLSEIHSKVKDRLHCGDFQSLEIWKECAERTVCQKKTDSFFICRFSRSFYL